jgi:hypothetical protein
MCVSFAPVLVVMPDARRDSLHCGNMIKEYGGPFIE